jgi:hypothetical protein
MTQKIFPVVQTKTKHFSFCDVHLKVLFSKALDVTTQISFSIFQTGKKLSSLFNFDV